MSRVADRLVDEVYEFECSRRGVFRKTLILCVVEILALTLLHLGVAFFLCLHALITDGGSMTTQQVLRALSHFPLLLRSAKRGSRTMLTFIIGALVSVSPFAVDAALLEGETVETTNFHGSQPDTTTIIGPLNRVVGPGVELQNFGFGDFVDIDFSDTNILIRLTIDQPFGFFEILRFLDVNGTIPAFTGVTVNPATNWTGFSASAIFFDPDRIDITLTGLGGLQGQQISLDITGNGNGNGVPEPPSYLLACIAALSMLGVISRRRKNAE